MRSEVSTHSLTPMTLDEAKALVRRYLGSFPSLNLHDPEIYIADLCGLLCGYPLWAGQGAIEKIKDTNKFPATRAEIKPLLDEHVRIPKYEQEWERGARALIADRSAPLLTGPVERKLSYEELRAKYDGQNGEKWGIENTTNAKTHMTPGQAKAALVGKYGQAAFDAVPNAKRRGAGIGAAAASVAASIEPAPHAEAAE